MCVSICPCFRKWFGSEVLSSQTEVVPQLTPTMQCDQHAHSALKLIYELNKIGDYDEHDYDAARFMLMYLTAFSHLAHQKKLAVGVRGIGVDLASGELRGETELTRFAKPVPAGLISAAEVLEFIPESLRLPGVELLKPEELELKTHRNSRNTSAYHIRPGKSGFNVKVADRLYVLHDDFSFTRNGQRMEKGLCYFRDPHRGEAHIRATETRKRKLNMRDAFSPAFTPSVPAVTPAFSASLPAGTPAFVTPTQQTPGVPAVQLLSNGEQSGLDVQVSKLSKLIQTVPRGKNLVFMVGVLTDS